MPFSKALADDSETDFGLQWTLLFGSTSSQGSLAGGILSELLSLSSKHPLAPPSNTVSRSVRNAFGKAIQVSADIISPPIREFNDDVDICRFVIEIKKLAAEMEKVS
jgi:hypothetical protein